MTPKEKAKIIVFDMLVTTKHMCDAKRNALVAVEHILQLIPNENKLSLTDYSYVNFKYWQDVKKEIELL